MKKHKDKASKDLTEYARLKTQMEAKAKTVEGTVEKIVTEHIKVD